MQAKNGMGGKKKESYGPYHSQSTLTAEIPKKNSPKCPAVNQMERMWWCYCSRVIVIFGIVVVLEDIDWALALLNCTNMQQKAGLSAKSGVLSFEPGTTGGRRI